MPVEMRHLQASPLSEQATMNSLRAPDAHCLPLRGSDHRLTRCHPLGVREQPAQRWRWLDGNDQGPQSPEVEAAILYGSRALGRHRPASDIDLALIGPALNATALARIDADRDDLLLP